MSSPLLVTVGSAILGACVGSFLNVVIYRIPVMLERQWQQEAATIRGEEPPVFPLLNLALPGSHCPHCSHSLTAVENVPVLSYLLLRGACRHCGARISARYPLVELLTAVLTVAVVMSFGVTIFSLGALVFVWALIALSFIDVDTQLLPDNITLPLLWGGILFNLLTGSVSLEESVIGAAAGYTLLWSIYWLFKLLTRKEGMGYGDFKLMAAIGAFLGWKSLSLVVLLSSSVGALVGVCLVLFAGHKRDTHIPFGPYLALAGLATLFAQQLKLGYIGLN